MPRPRKSAEDHIQIARDFLQHSDQEFEACDPLQGSEKLWGAASHAVTAIARQRGWAFSKYNHHLGTGPIHRSPADMAVWGDVLSRNAVDRLAEEYNDRVLSLGFSVAQKFHANFYHDSMEDDEIERDRPMVHEFVYRILNMANEAGQ